MLNPSLCHWEANWSVCVEVVRDVCVCVNATDPKGIRLISKQPWDLACMCVYLLSFSPHAELDCAAREQHSRRLGYLSMIHLCYLGRENERVRGMK